MNKNIILHHWKRSFFTIWAGQAVSLITSAILQMAIIWHLTNTTGSALVLSIASLVGFLPQAIFGTMIGVLVDRWNRKFVMIGADLIIAIAGVILALISLTMTLPIWVVMMILFVRSLGTAFHSPALSAVTPLLVPEENLTKCAGYSQSIQSISYMISPAISAFLYAHYELNTIIAIDVIGALIACITVALVAIPKQTNLDNQMKHNFFGELKEGYAVIKSNKGIYALLWIGTLFAFAYLPINALFPLMTMNYFGGTTFHASIVEIVFAAGMLIGGILLGTWGGFHKRFISISSSLTVMGIAIMISGLLPPEAFVIFVVCCALLGFSAPFYNGVQLALIQEKIEPQYLGRVFGLLGSIMSFAMPLGLIFSGVFADQIGINNWFTITGIGIIAISILAVSISSIRNLDR
jgi:DHA3 family macrolide efflux protein-like MFS transporter